MRQELVTLIDNLHEAKEYKSETYYLAVSIADRFLFNLVQDGVTKKQSPCHVTVAISCLLMAAKIE